MKGKPFAFRGCGWKAKVQMRSPEDLVWINAIIDLFTKLFGKDYMEYNFTKDHGTQVAVPSDPRLVFSYDHAKWEASFQETVQSRACDPLPRSAVILKVFSSFDVKQGFAHDPLNDLNDITPLDKSEPF